MTCHFGRDVYEQSILLSWVCRLKWGPISLKGASMVIEYSLDIIEKLLDCDSWIHVMMEATNRPFPSNSLIARKYHQIPSPGNSLVASFLSSTQTGKTNAHFMRS